MSVGCLRLGVISVLGAYVKCQSDTSDFLMRKILELHVCVLESDSDLVVSRQIIYCSLVTGMCPTY